MSLIIVGGHECMYCRYREICEKRGHHAKIFMQMTTGFCKHIGSADGIILFTSTVSHKLVETAVREAKRRGIPVLRSHSSSGSALSGLLNGIESNSRCDA